MDESVDLLMSLGAVGRGRWVKCELVVVEKSRSWKHRIAHQNEELINFPLLKGDPPVSRWVCAFSGIFGGIEKGGSNVSWWRGGRWDLGEREMFRWNEQLTNFPCLKSDFPVCGWVCAFADVFGGIEKGEVGWMWDGGGGEVRDWEKEMLVKSLKTHQFSPFKM